MKPIKIHLLERLNPITGFKETVHYTGDIKSKPKGYKLVRTFYDTPYIDEFGLTGRC